MDPVLIQQPMCQRCDRVESPVILSEADCKVIERFIHHLKANICCKTCGAVMMLEKAHG
jgi:hypothetical protein